MNNSLSVFIARRRWLKRIFLNALPEQAHKRIFNKVDFYFDPRDMKGPSFHFAYDLEEGFSNYEERTKKALFEYLPEGGVFYDIGANIGMYSIYSLINHTSAQLYSFEPEPHTYSLVKKTLESAKGDYHLYNVAIGKDNEERKIYTSTVNDGGHSFLNEGIDKDDSKFSVVKIVNLDDFRCKNSIPLPDVVKIDVEGFELEVLKGMRQTIIDARPIMQIESNNIDLANKKAFWTFMKDFEDYGLQCIDPNEDRKKSMNMEELCAAAQRNLKQGRKLSDYFYCLKK